MRFGFRDVNDGRGQTRPRPIVDVVVEGFDLAPQACLLDSGATAVRFGTHVAEMCGIDLSNGDEQQIAVGGTTVSGRSATVSMEISDGSDGHRWEATAWFCEPWIPAFGLLGLSGFFDHFEVLIDSYSEVFELTPI